MSEATRLLTEADDSKLGAPQPVVREPLTEEQVAEACGWKAGMGCKPLPTELRIARAIEAAHGITQKGGKDAE
jgi:hypothetical protein